MPVSGDSCTGPIGGAAWAVRPGSPDGRMDGRRSQESREPGFRRHAPGKEEKPGCSPERRKEKPAGSGSGGSSGAASVSEWCLGIAGHSHQSEQKGTKVTKIQIRRSELLGLCGPAIHSLTLGRLRPKLRRAVGLRGGGCMPFFVTFVAFCSNSEFRRFHGQTRLLSARWRSPLLPKPPLTLARHLDDGRIRVFVTPVALCSKSAFRAFGCSVDGLNRSSARWRSPLPFRFATPSRILVFPARLRTSRPAALRSRFTGISQQR
jgi:hypothetical protein